MANKVREVVRCQYCRLNQYCTGNGLCRRCGKPLPMPRAEEPVQKHAQQKHAQYAQSQPQQVQPVEFLGTCPDAPLVVPEARPDWMGKVVRSFRLRAGLSQKILARRMGTSRTEIVKIETGSLVPFIPTLLRLSAALGVGVSHLIDGISPPLDSFAIKIVPYIPRLDENKRTFILLYARMLAFGEQLGAQ